MALLIQLYDSLVDNNCGKLITLPDNTTLTIALLAYIDDMLLLSDTPHQFQLALDLVTKWARKIRMRLNIGEDKSAAMIINATGLNVANNKWKIGSTLLPIVQKY